MSGTDRISIFKDTIKQCSENELLLKAIENSIAGTKLYKEGDTPALPAKKYDECKITVTEERTFEAALSLMKEYPGCRVGVLNFASAVNPGGGVVMGASAQEECLCRCSTLYPCLITNELKKTYYSPHRKGMSFAYTDACIYTPDIYVIKTDTIAPEPMPEEKWYKTDVLTCAAPNLSTWYMSRGKQFEIHKKRGSHIISIAAAHGIDILVLGAFGCGAFRNDPETVAMAYAEILPEFSGYFKEIRFGVYCGRHKENYEKFKEVLEEK